MLLRVRAVVERDVGVSEDVGVLMTMNAGKRSRMWRLVTTPHFEGNFLSQGAIHYRLRPDVEDSRYFGAFSITLTKPCETCDGEGTIELACGVDTVCEFYPHEGPCRCPNNCIDGRVPRGESE